MSAIDRAVESNQRHQHEREGDVGKAPPRQQLFVLTCMDARVDAWRLLGLSWGDAHVVRNAGGRATGDVVRSLALSQHLLGTREVMVVHHTDCGLCTPDPDDVTERVRAAVGDDVAVLEPLAFTDQDQTVRDDVATLASSPYTHPDTVVRGFVYDVATGALREVD